MLILTRIKFLVRRRTTYRRAGKVTAETLSKGMYAASLSLLQIVIKMFFELLRLTFRHS